MKEIAGQLYKQVTDALPYSLAHEHAHKLIREHKQVRLLGTDRKGWVVWVR